MAELEIDQSNLPRVQEVCQCFAVLEDGVLAHSLQEQEIEQYYTTNIQKNQLVQNDIRVAKRLQDEEEEQRAQQSALLRQASRQLEEQDFEYARVIQEEIQRCTEETLRRELDDEEMAKRMQEEEDRTRRSSEQENYCEGSSGDSALTSPHTYDRQEQYLPSTSRWHCSTSDYSDLSGPLAESPRGIAAQKNSTPWSNEGHTDSFRETRNEFRELLSDDSEDLDAVFSELLSVRSQRRNKKLSTVSPQRRASLPRPQERNYRSLSSHRSFTEDFQSWEEETEEWDEDCYENGEAEHRKARNWDKERNYREDSEGWHRNTAHDRDSRLAEARERQCSRTQSVRLYDRSRHSHRDAALTWTYKDNPDKHVRFQDDTQRYDGYQEESGNVWQMLGQVLRERGVSVRFGVNGWPLQIRPQRRDSQVLHGSEVSCGDSQPHQRAFQRAATTRHSFHGDIRERRRLSHRENSERDHREDRDRHHDNRGHDSEVYEISSRDLHLINKERRGSRRWKEHKYPKDGDGDERETTTREHRHWRGNTEERLSSEEEQEVQEVKGRVERPRRRAPQRSQSLSSSRASTRDRSRHMLAVPGASRPQKPVGSLDLGELQQVLQDEELARKLQEEEEKQLRRVRDLKNSQSIRSSYPDRDFRVAQVAQDEEIARFMQKQEIKSKRRSRELEGPVSWREHRAMISHHDRRTRDRAVHRERLDSEGLPSPTEDCSPENQPPSPISTIPPAPHIRNIAEELDPTFQARRQGPDSLRGGQTGSTCQPLPVSQSGLQGFVEEPTFIPPTKRQTDKSGRPKAKDKKENCKQQ